MVANFWHKACLTGRRQKPMHVRHQGNVRINYCCWKLLEQNVDEYIRSIACSSAGHLEGRQAFVCPAPFLTGVLACILHKTLAEVAAEANQLHLQDPGASKSFRVTASVFDIVGGKLVWL